VSRAYVARLSVAVSLITIAILTLYPDPNTVTSEWSCIFCSSRASADVILNLILFAPLGAGLGLARVRTKHLLAIALLLSGTVEVLQLVIPGRDASVGDLISNAAGCWVGYALACSAPSWLAPKGALGRWLPLAASFVIALIVIATGMMLQPALPNSAYYGQWTPDLEHLDRYRGRVLEATVGSSPVPSRRLENSEAIRTLLRNGSPIQVRAVAAKTTSRLSSIFSVADAEENMIVLIGPMRDRLLYIFRTRGESFRLDRPALSVSDVMDLTPGDTIDISTSRWEGDHCLAVNRETHCGLGFTAGSGWTLLWFSESLPSGLQSGLSVMWLCLLLLPFGLWLRPNLGSVFGAAIVIAALLWAPFWTGMLPTPLREWVGSAAGVVAGLCLGLVASRLLSISGERGAGSG
jgi:VanZ family protein